MLTREERAIDRLARIARHDTVYGGCRALVIAKRMDSINPSGPGYEYIVSDVYSRSSGQRSEQYEAWECPECGQVYLGRETAMRCCTGGDDYE
jgi:predicted RNA-binding Zn-ribbon protein involved in translation (DUF1610 family)